MWGVAHLQGKNNVLGRKKNSILVEKPRYLERGKKRHQRESQPYHPGLQRPLLGITLLGG